MITPAARHRVLLGVASLALAACAGAPPTTPNASPAPSVIPTGPPSTGPAASPYSLVALEPEPVLDPAGGEQYVNPGAVLPLGGELVMLANSFTAFPGPSRVDLFSSGDGLAWETLATDPVLTSDQVPFAPATAFLMSALPAEDGTLTGWVYTYNGAAGTGVIGRATAPVPEGPWAVDPEPVLEPGSAGSWDEQMVLEPDVVRTDDGFAMFYTGVDGDGVHRIGRATSPDGIAWTRSAKPILAGSQDWDRGTIGEPEVEPVEGGWVMVYRTASRGSFGLGLATSPDGVTWTPGSANPLLDPATAPTPSFWQASLVTWQDRLLYLLEGGSLGGTSIYAMELVAAAD